MENPISITSLNDFIFCPVSIYFHQLDGDSEKVISQDTYQLNGTAAHQKSDAGTYSTRKSMLQGISVYCEKYDLIGKIDTFDTSTGLLTERKKKIIRIYDGYVFQIYAQYFSLREMGYDVKRLRLYSMDDNKSYDLPKPEEDPEMLRKFEALLQKMKIFQFDGFQQENPLKCMKCIYEPLCSFSTAEESNAVSSGF